MSLSQELVRKTDNFYALCKELSTAVEHLRCKGKAKDPMAAYIGTVLTGSAIVAGAAAVFALFPRMSTFRPKSFVN